MDKKDIASLILENFDKLSKMSVPEYTLYRKWTEINEKEWTDKELQRIWEVKHSIWKPKKPEDFEKLDIDIILADKPDTNLTWTILRTFISTMPWNQSVGRMLRFIVYDKKTSGYLGVISIGSDFISLSPRDNYIGWTFKDRIDKKMLAYTAMCSSIVPTQPFGFNYVGGKLITLMCCSDVAVGEWNKKYKEDLKALTTTSLYGGYSQYNRLKYWKKCGTSEGKIPLEPEDNIYRQVREWVKENYHDKFVALTENKDKILSRPKSKMLQFAYAKLHIKPPENNAPRGVYFCELFDESRAFLRREKVNSFTPKFDNRLFSLVQLWKEKYAAKRVKNVVESKRYNTNTLFYDNILGKSWEETKKIYLSEVGR